MDFVALLSGGKDSCYNIWKCMQYGHRLVCIANLQSPTNDEENEEINSFMYQSAGSSVIPAYEECLGVPLLRQEIKGKAVSQSMEYESQVEGDEVEDLYILLREVVTRIPSVKGVSCGAIVSNYQRHRVENICQRLGLTSLSYLWQRDRKELFHEIVHHKMHAVLVKVAGAGLDPVKHLGKALLELSPMIDRLNSKFGLDYCGEGGEYESLVLDAPFFKKRIEILEKTIIYDDEDPSVGMLKILKWRVCEKPSEPESSPIQYDPFQTIRPMNESSLLFTNSTKLSQTNQNLRSIPKLSSSFPGYGQTELIYPAESFFHYDSSKEIVQNQVRNVMEKLKSILEYNESHIFDCIFVHLYISKISLFGTVNEEYCRWFQSNPPSRCCVEMMLPYGTHVALYAHFQKGSYSQMSDAASSQRQVVHIRSMSEWAPLCIGPYAQSNKINNFLVYVAGQIPLDPMRMVLLHPPSSSTIKSHELFEDIKLSLRHVDRVLSVNSSSIKQALLGCIYVNMQRVDSTLFEVIEDIFWKCYDELFTISEKQNKETKLNSSEDDYDYDYDYDEDEDKNEESSTAIRTIRFPFAVIAVPGLPRDASVEVELSGHCNSVIPSVNWIYKKESYELTNSDGEETHSTDLMASFFSVGKKANNFRINEIQCTEASLILPRAVATGNLCLQALPGVDLIQICTSSFVNAVVHAFKRLFSSSKLKLSSFITVNISYQRNIFDSRELEIVLKSELRGAGFRNTSLVLLPTHFVGSPLLQLSFSCIDFIQIETETWVYAAK